MEMKIINHPSIVYAGPIQIEEGRMPYRMVIRHIPNDLHPEYIVHRENLRAKETSSGVIEWSNLSFYWGDYCGSLKDAKASFKERSKLASGMDI